MKSKTRRIITFVDPETGEIIEGIELLEGDQLRTKEQNTFYQNQLKRYEDKTDFVWVKFLYNKDFYSNIQAENLTRLMYFASFIGKDNYVMQDSDIREMLGINANQKTNFLKELTENKIIQTDVKRLLLNSLYFGKGSTICDTAFARLYTNAIQKLYNSCKNTNEHRYLSYIFRMIPFLHRQTNILCTNQDEQDINHIAYRTVTEFYALIGKDKTHTSRFKKRISHYRIDGELIVGFFNTLTELNKNGKYVVINPKLLYGGDKLGESYKLISKLFEDEKLQYQI